MKARILVTDGQKTVKLFWIDHDGKDVHCGWPISPNKLTYHESGKIHTTQNGKNINGDWRSPLADIKGMMALITLQGVRFLLAASEPVPTPWKKYDALLVIDLRSIPDHVDPHIAVGLLEIGRLDAIAHLLTLPFDVSNNLNFTAQQASIITSVNPWVWVVQYWLHR